MSGPQSHSDLEEKIKRLTIKYKAEAMERRQVEMEKEVLEMLQKQQGKKDEKPSLKDQLVQRKEHLERDINIINEALEAIKALAFQPGDVAFHPLHGNVIVREIRLGSEYNDSIASHLNKLVASIACKKTGHVVLASELLPISSATKVLYDRNNS